MAIGKMLSPLLERNRRSMPARSLLEVEPPVVFASRLGVREGNCKKPVYQIHKWWARRLGSIFRSILIGATTDVRGNADADFDELFYRRQDLRGLTVLDPFVGGGTSLVEAAKLGAHVIGVDIDPVACFVTSKELAPCDENRLLAAFRQVESAVKESILTWYRTKLPDGRSGTILYAFWVDEIVCPTCKEKFDGHPHYQLARDRTNKLQTVFCAHCNMVHDVPLDQERLHCRECGRRTTLKRGPVYNGRFHCPGCKNTTVLRDLTGKNRRIPQRMFALEVVPNDTDERIYKRADRDDIRLLDRATSAWTRRASDEKFVPPEIIPIQDRDDPRPLSYGYRQYRDLFNPRQLLCLSLIAEAIRKVDDTASREFLALALSDALAANNMFCFYAFDYRKLTPLFGLHAYTKVSRPVENNVWGTDFGRGSFEKCVHKVIRAKRYAREPYEYRYETPHGCPTRVVTGESITCAVLESLPDGPPSKQPLAVLLNQSAEDLSTMPAASVDLILTDPPYYNNLAYSELSDFYHVWLKRMGLATYAGNGHRRTPLKESLYVRAGERRAGPDHDRFGDGLAKAFAGCARVLKDPGLMVFTFHHNDPRAWTALTIAICRGGFEITSVFPVRSEGQSRFHSYEGSLKWDVVFCCRKRNAPQVRTVGADPTRTIPRSVAANAARELKRWRRMLSDAKMTFSPADAKSLRSGLLAMGISRLPVSTEESLLSMFSASANPRQRTRLGAKTGRRSQ